MFPFRAAPWWKTSPLLGLALLGLVLLGVAAVARPADERVAFFPDDYRQWTVAKFKFIGPESPQWQAQGGLRHHFANDIALSSWGRFREGSVIVDERVHARLNEQKVWEEAGLAHVAVMRKDSVRHAETGGWYFNFFSAKDQSRGITASEAKTRCFDACHQAQGARDFVFSDPRR